VLPRLAYLAATNALALPRPLSMSEREKEVEILVLRHQLLVLQPQVAKPAFTDVDRAFVAGLPRRLPVERLRRLLPVGCHKSRMPSDLGVRWPLVIAVRLRRCTGG
jgi:hypothetical protein